MATVSYVVWTVLAGAVLGWELYTVTHEKRNGSLPLTRIVRDRLMRQSVVAKIVVLGFLAWLVLHFLTPLDW